MSKPIGETYFIALIMLNIATKVHFFSKTAKFLTKILM